MKTSRMYVSTLSNRSVVTRIRVSDGQITTRTYSAALRRLGAAIGEGLTMAADVGNSDQRLVSIDVINAAGQVVQVIS